MLHHFPSDVRHWVTEKKDSGVQWTLANQLGDLDFVGDQLSCLTTFPA